jgi:hypothetical protein
MTQTSAGKSNFSEDFFTAALTDFEQHVADGHCRYPVEEALRLPSLTLPQFFALDDLNELIDRHHKPVGYHNVGHYAEVAASNIFLLQHVPHHFSQHQQYMMTTAAIIHDLGHDGTTNTVDSVHQRYRLEEKSLTLAAPVLRKNFAAQDVEFIRHLVHATDISKAPSETESPAATARHNVDQNLQQACVFVQAADIFTAAALSLRCARKSDLALAQENPVHMATPERRQGFLTHIAHPAFAALPEPVASILLKRSEAIQKEYVAAFTP